MVFELESTQMNLGVNENKDVRESFDYSKIAICKFVVMPEIPCAELPGQGFGKLGELINPLE